MKNKKVSGKIKFKGLIFTFEHDGVKMELRAVPVREPDAAEREAISEFGEDLDRAIKRVLRKVDMSEAHDEAVREILGGESIDVDKAKSFKEFIEKLNSELNGTGNSGGDHSDFLRHIFGKRD